MYILECFYYLLIQLNYCFEQMEQRVAKSKSCLELVLSTMAQEQKNRNYIIAQKLRKEAEQLKNKIDTLQKKSARRRQMKQKQELTEMQIKQAADLQNKWKEIIKEAEDEIKPKLQRLKNIHDDQLHTIEDEHQKQEEEYHESGAVIELKRKQYKLAKQCNFIEAHEMQQERFKLQQQEKETMAKLRSEKLKVQVKKLKVKQKAQKEAITKEFEAHINQLKRKKNQEEFELTQKHKNVKRGFAFEQEKENLIKTGRIKNSEHWIKTLSPGSRSVSKHFLSSQKISLRTG